MFLPWSLRRGTAATAAIVVLAWPVSAAGPPEIAVSLRAGMVDLSVRSAPVSAALDQLGKAAGFEVVYQGPRPSDVVTVELRGRPPAEATVALLEGLGLSYVLVYDPSGLGLKSIVLDTSRGSGSGSGLGSGSGPDPGPAPPTVDVDRPMPFDVGGVEDVPTGADPVMGTGPEGPVLDPPAFPHSVSYPQ